MIGAENRRVQADPSILTALNELVHTLGTQELTQHAISLGIRPPDDRPDWAIVREYDRDFNFRGLFWVGPDDE